ncbi:MAG TPA: hypothetical protein VMI31_05775 [Fimbriimonadaceae bacterium]|nr:hypothetical protein [Fimbriimonadaceae bacterium]
MRTAFVLAGLLVSAPAFEPGHHSPVAKSDARNANAERLIGQLVDFGKPTAGAHPTAWASQFMAIDEQPQFHGGILGSAKPTVDPTMRKLVQMGVAALPSLIAHLRDSRPTKLVETHGFGFGAMWFSDEYDPRYSNPRRQPGGINQVGMDIGFRNRVSGEKYTVKVGDMCFVAIGQIVDRNFCALRYQPSACEVINSPVHTPALAEAVKADWGGLTAEGHRAQLEADACDLSPWRPAEAVKRMLYYYHADGEKLAVKLLDRKLYDSSALWDWADKMVKTDDPETWRTLDAGAVQKLGAAAAGRIPHGIWERANSDNDPKEPKARERRLLKTLFPGFDPYRNVFDGIADVGDQNEIVEAVSTFRSAKIDAAVHSLFERAIARPMPPAEDQDAVWQHKSEQDRLAIDAADRLRGKGFDAEFLAYFKKRLSEVGNEFGDQPYNRDYYRQQFEQEIRKLSKGSAT